MQYDSVTLTLTLKKKKKILSLFPHRQIFTPSQQSTSHSHLSPNITLISTFYKILHLTHSFWSQLELTQAIDDNLSRILCVVLPEKRPLLYLSVLLLFSTMGVYDSTMKCK